MADTFPKNTIDDNGLKKVWDMAMDELDLKVDKEAGKGLSTNDYTTTEKNKLAGIASGAEVNTVTSVAGKTGAVTLNKSDVGLSNVGNFKAVSTSANQGLTNTEKSNARANIDTPSNGDIQSSKTIKSSVVTVADAAPINAEDITVDITPVQDLHGYDRPWAGGTYYNKWDEEWELGNISPSDGSNSPSSTCIRSKNYIPIIAGAEYYFNNKNLRVPACYDANKDFISATTATRVQGGGWLLTMPSNAVYFRFDMVSNYGATYLNDLALNYPSSYREYSSYSNICPIEGWTGAELDRVGRNWMKEPLRLGDIRTIDGQEQASDIYLRSEYTPMYPTFTYYFRTPTTIRIWLYFYGRNKQYLGQNTVLRSYSNRAFTIPSNAFYARILIMVSEYGYSTYQNDICINISDANFNGRYEPYQGQQYTASFGETVYGGKWHVTAGGTDKTMAEVDLGSLNYIAATVKDGTLFYTTTNPVTNMKNSVSSVAANALCSSMPIGTMQMVNGGITEGLSIGPDQSRIRIFSRTAYKNMSASDFKTAMDGVQLCYELETPATLSTPKQNVPMLKGINTVYADCGDVSLKYQPDNVVGELKGEIQVANSFVAKMALRQGSGAKDFSYGGWSFRIRIFRSMGQISLYVENISASNVTEQAIVKVFMDTSDYRAPEELRPRMNIVQAATYTTPSGWAIQVYLKDDGYIMFTGVAPEVGASAPTSSNWNLVEPWATHQQAKDLFNN